MLSLAEWIAPAATVIAAMMTAANLGARVTGWGFVVFTAGSLTWCYIGMSTGQQPLVFTNAFLTVVNAIGIWRWLGRQAKFEDGGEQAEQRSAASSVPTLYSAAGLIGKDIVTAGGDVLGELVDAMLECDGDHIAYVVVTDGKNGGLGETLRAIASGRLQFGAEHLQFDGDRAAFESLPALATDKWPASVNEPAA